MNSSKNSSLEELNALMFERNKPVLIFITFFMLLGIMGNSLVIYVYTFRMKISTLKVFIVYLGLVDMLDCCLTVPLDMVKLIMPLMYPCDFFCHSHYFILYFTCTSSALTLCAIARERFNRVCRCLGTQTSPQHAKWIGIGVTVISLLAAVPVYLSFQRIEIRLNNSITSHQCRSKNIVYWNVTFVILFSIFCILLIIIFVMYFFVWKQTRRHLRQQKARRFEQVQDEGDHLTHSNHHETTHNSSQINMTIFSITALFAISFGPSFILHLVQPIRTQKNHALILIIRRLWVLNCSLNPVAYGICNGEFRLEFKRLFSKEINQKTSNMMTTRNEMEL